MSTINLKMTALADEIRELSGITNAKDIDEMTADVGAANDEVSSQSDLIAQLKDAANNLPDAGSGVDTSGEDALVSEILTEYSNSRVTNIADYAFAYKINLTSVNFPACITIGSAAFSFCSRLTNANFPVCENIGSSAFANCSSLQYVNLPVCKFIYLSAFHDCTSLTEINLPVLSSVYGDLFRGCTSLTKVVLGYSRVAPLGNISAFASTPMSVSTLTGSFGSIYVPASLVDAYKSATNWATYADRITAIPEEGGN